MPQMSKVKKLLRKESLIEPEVHNPFSYPYMHLSVLDKIKVAVCSITLFPLRLVLVMLFLLVASLFAALATCCLDLEKDVKPLSGWRKILRYPVRICVRGILFSLGFHWVKVTGKLCSPEEAVLLVSAPHSSFIDALALFVIGFPLTGVSRRENDKIPIIGVIIRALQPIYVSRTDVNSRKKTIEEIKRRASSSEGWPHIVIFPEGTCTNRKCLITFKPGAFYAGCPVQPLVLKYPNVLDTVTWTWSGPSAAKLLWLTMCQFHNKLEIEILPVYKPSTEEISDAKLFARNVRELMARCLNIPVTDHTYEDCRLMLQAVENKLPPSAGLVEYHKISTKLSVRMDSMKDLLEKYAEIDADGDGKVHLEEFAKYLNLPVTKGVEELFSLYDRNDSGYIDFREYLIGLALVSKPANNEETIKLAFEVFDVNKDGRLTELELRQILQSAYPSITDLNVNCLFKQADVNGRGSITYEEFREFSLRRPEYAVLFSAHNQKSDQMSQGDNSQTDWEICDLETFA